MRSGSIVNIAIAGLGTVGSTVVQVLRANAALIEARVGQPVAVKAVSARNRNVQRNCDLGGIEWVADARQLASRSDIDIVVELIGGADGIAHDLAKECFRNGKHLVTANKAMLAKHGTELAALAESKKLGLGFEASVAGGIPIIKTLREALAGNQITAVRGILNGTCNYILTRMQEAKVSFAEALTEAQAKGYAEADPSADIDGIDSANKLAILAALAFGVQPDLAAVKTGGIRDVTALDIARADKLNYRIKLLGRAEKSASGIELSVAPCLVPLSMPLATVHGPNNAVMVRGDYVGELTLQGPGAGGAATASAVLADIIDIAMGRRNHVFGVPATQLNPVMKTVESPASYYLRMEVENHTGVMAQVTTALSRHNISIVNMLQPGKESAPTVPVMMTTAHVNASDMREALMAIRALPSHKSSLLMRMEG